MGAKIEKITDDLEELPRKIDKLETQLEGFLEKLRFLRSQVFIFENRLRVAYAEGNDANAQALAAK